MIWLCTKKGSHWGWMRNENVVMHGCFFRTDLEGDRVWTDLRGASRPACENCCRGIFALSKKRERMCSSTKRTDLEGNWCRSPFLRKFLRSPGIPLNQFRGKLVPPFLYLTVENQWHEPKRASQQRSVPVLISMSSTNQNHGIRPIESARRQHKRRHEAHPVQIASGISIRSTAQFQPNLVFITNYIWIDYYARTGRTSCHWFSAVSALHITGHRDNGIGRFGGTEHGENSVVQEVGLRWRSEEFMNRTILQTQRRWRLVSNVPAQVEWNKKCRRSSLPVAKWRHRSVGLWWHCIAKAWKYKEYNKHLAMFHLNKRRRDQETLPIVTDCRTMLVIQWVHRRFIPPTCGRQTKDR